MSLYALVVKNYRELKEAFAAIEQRGFPIGGLPGQIPTKASVADYDWTWATPGVRGLEIEDADTNLVSDHANRYLSFVATGAKTYTVELSDDPGLPASVDTWSLVTLRNSAASGNLLVGEAFGVTLSGDQGKLLVAPGGILQLVKAGSELWHIL